MSATLAVTRRALPFVLLLAGCGQAGPTSLGDSIQRFCDIATEVDRDPSLDPSERAIQIADRSRDEIHDPDFARLMSSFATMSADARTPALRAAARENGLGEDWTCPALEL